MVYIYYIHIFTTCMHTCIYVHTHTRTHAHTHTHTHPNLHPNPKTHTHIHFKSTCVRPSALYTHECSFKQDMDCIYAYINT